MKSYVILNNGATAAMSRVNPQPTPSKNTDNRWDFSFLHKKGGTAGRNHTIESLNDDFFGILNNAPYTVGQRVAVKESWATKLISDNVVYRSDYPSDTRYRWRSPVTMPLEAVRTWAVVESRACVRVQDVTQEQAKKLVGEGNCAPHRPSSTDCPKHADNSLKRDCYYCEYKMDFIRKHGIAWNNNEYIFLTQFKIETK